ncbi:MAG: putative quinol monooxygenase [Chloroflexota bacterium]
MLMVTGKFAISADDREQFLEFVMALVPVERGVAGCLSFDIYEDVVTPNTFLVLEQWEDEAALDTYTETDAYIQHDDTLSSFVIGEAVWDEYEF